MVARYPTQHSPHAPSGRRSPRAVEGGAGAAAFLAPGAARALQGVGGAAALEEAAATGLAWRLATRVVPVVGVIYGAYTLYEWAQGGGWTFPASWGAPTCYNSSARGGITTIKTQNSGCGNGSNGFYNPGDIQYQSDSESSTPSQVANAWIVTCYYIGPKEWLQSANGYWWIQDRVAVYSRPNTPEALAENPSLKKGYYAMPEAFYSPVEVPILQPMPVLKPPSILPGVAPAPEPEMQPDNKPDDEPDTRPKPWVDPHPSWPSVITVPGDLTWPDVIVTPGTRPGTKPGTGPGTSPGPSPDPRTEPDPDAGGTTTTAPPSHTYAPPKKGEKERKVRVRHGGLHVAVNVATEGLDFVDSLYKGINAGLPKGERAHCRPHDYRCKLNHMWKHWDDRRFDAAKFVEAWVNNQFEDMAYGMLGQMTGRAQGRLADALHVPGGGAGQTGLNRAVRNAAGSVDTSGDDNFDPLPQLVIDEDTGKAHIEWDLLD